MKRKNLKTIVATILMSSLITMVPNARTITGNSGALVDITAPVIKVQVPATLTMKFGPTKDDDDIPSVSIKNTSDLNKLCLQSMSVSGRAVSASSRNEFSLVSSLEGDYLGLDKRYFSLKFKLSTDNDFSEFDSYTTVYGNNSTGTVNFGDRIVIAPTEDISIDFDLSRNNFTESAKGVGLMDISLVFDILDLDN